MKLSDIKQVAKRWDGLEPTIYARRAKIAYLSRTDLGILHWFLWRFSRRYRRALTVARIS